MHAVLQLRIYNLQRTGDRGKEESPTGPDLRRLFACTAAQAWVNRDSHCLLCQAFPLLVNSISFWCEEITVELDPYIFMI